MPPVSETQLLQGQIGARKPQMQPVMRGSSAPQIQMNLEQLGPSQSMPSRSEVQALPMLQMHPSPRNPGNLDQPADQSPARHERSPNLYNPGQPGPLLHYSPRDRMRLKYSMILEL